MRTLYPIFRSMPSKKQRVAVLTRLYADEGKTLREIGELFGVSKQAVHEILTKAGVRMRSRGGCYRVTHLELVERQIDIPSLVDRYITLRTPLSKLSGELGVSSSSVRKVLVREGVEIRSRSQARKLKFREVGG